MPGSMTKPNRPLRGCLTVLVVCIFGLLAILSVFVGPPDHRYGYAFLFWIALIVGGIWTFFPEIREESDSSNQNAPEDAFVPLNGEIEVRCRHCGKITPREYECCIWCHKLQPDRSVSEI